MTIDEINPVIFGATAKPKEICILIERNIFDNFINRVFKQTIFTIHIHEINMSEFAQ